MLNQIGYGQQPQASQPPYYGADYSMQQATMYPPAQPENSPLPYSTTMNPSTGFHLVSSFTCSLPRLNTITNVKPIA